MSEITSWVRQYLAHDLGFDDLVDRLRDYPFADPWRNHPDMPTDTVGRNEYLDAHVPDVEGTLLELRECTVREGLPWEAYQRILGELAATSPSDPQR